MAVSLKSLYQTLREGFVAPTAAQAEEPVLVRSIQESEVLARKILTQLDLVASQDADLLGVCKNLICKNVEYRLISNPLSPDRRVLKEEIKVLNETFTALSASKGYVFGREEGAFFDLLDQEVAEQVKAIRLEEKKRIISSCRQGLALAELTPENVSLNHEQCQKELCAIRQIKSFLHELVVEAKVPAEVSDRFTFKIDHSGREDFPVSLEVDSFEMAYSIYDILRSLDIVKGEFGAGIRRFRLSYHDSEKLVERLREIQLWHEDFSMILGDLLSSDDEGTRAFYSTGRKTTLEIMRSPVGISEAARRELVACGRSFILLFNQIGLDLNTHPEKDVYKALFEQYYHIEHLLASNGRDPKRFMDLDPYVSVLNVDQIKKICPHLNKHLVLQKQAMNFTGQATWSQALATLSEYGIENQLEVYRQAKASDLQTTAKSLLDPSILPYCEEASRALLASTHPVLSVSVEKHKRDMFNIYPQLRRLESIQAIEGFCLEEFKRFLKERSVVNLGSAACFEVSEEMLARIYRGEKTTRYAGNIHHANITALFRSFRESPLVQQALAEKPDYEETFSMLEAEFIRRMHTYHQMPAEGFYGKKVFNEAVKVLEQYVARIYFHDISGVDLEKLNRSLVTMVARCDDELRHCNEGFCGRIQDILHGLISSSAAESLKDAVKDEMTGTLQGHFERLCMGNTQSSHLVSAKAEALHYLGIEPSSVDKPYEGLSLRAVELVEKTIADVNPVKIYEIAYAYITDQFWQMNVEGEDEKIYKLLESLGFGSNRADLNQAYRVRGDENNRWQYAFFQQALPKYLAPYLVAQGFLKLIRPKEGWNEFSKGDQFITMRRSYPQPVQPLGAAMAAPAPAAAGQRAVGQYTQSKLPSINTGTS